VNRRRLLLKMTMPCIGLAAVLFGAFFSTRAQNQNDAIPDRLMTNQDVIEMLQSGLSPRAVILRIHESPCKFDKSAAGLEVLRSANVPYKVVLAMMQAPELPTPIKGRIPMVIPDSTLVLVALSESIDSESQKPGYVIYFRVLEDVRIRGLRVIARGARARGRLLDSRGLHLGEPARLEWNMMDVETVDGQRVPLRGGSERAGSELQQEKSVSASEGEEFRAFTYGSRKVNVPAPIAPDREPSPSESSHPKQTSP
jgi:hypothetical protein